MEQKDQIDIYIGGRGEDQSMNTKDNSTQFSNDTSSGAATTTLREEIRGSWRWKRNVSGGLTTGNGFIQLAPRDFQILKFILAMKFATHLEIHQKFFRDVHSGSKESFSFEQARKRLRQLQQADLLRPFYIGVPRLKHLVISRKGFNLVREKFDEDRLPKPALFPDLHLLNHDRYVLHERLRLEVVENAAQWISDRALQSGVIPHLGLDEKSVPDAIYLLPSGLRIALEMEVAVKGKRAYQEKVRKYVSYFRQTAEANLAFDKVRFLCVKTIAVKNLKSHASIYPSFFDVELLSDTENPKSEARSLE